ncbi:MAG: hypothetical protein JWM78_2050 [Verrucomicrobiaceae bacterium]|nr:hypothetical protein [Verrucomicrobiaceae bacterium]
MSARCSTVLRPTSFPRFNSHLSSATVALILSAAVMPAFAVDATDVGAAGAAGASGVLGKAGGNGKNSQAGLGSSDFFNNVKATGGQGGNGGSSLPLLPGGNGGKGGAASATLQTGNQDFPTDIESQGAGTVAATGGKGGNGGSGLLPGNGGAGGAAAAQGTDTGTTNFDSLASSSLQVDASGGAGGSGRNGGAGGASTAQSTINLQTTTGASSSATAQGGVGGNAVLSGGKGGSANADASLTAFSYPSDSYVTAVAKGGNGGNSATGLNGNGGAATATSGGDFYARDFGLTSSATAVGGASGLGGLPLQGNGGDAIATASGSAHNAAYINSQSSAQGGDGVLRGGNAIANASASADMFGNASAQASGGAGKQAGAAIATATVSNGFLDTTANAVANYTGAFVRQVSARGETFAVENQTASTIYTQARVGDTSSIMTAAPAPAADTSLIARAIAPTKAEAATALAGNTTLKNAFAGCSVWGLGEFGTGGGLFDFNSASTSYTFDINTLADPQHLWLGLLDSNLPSATTGNFHFSIAGEGTTLFEHDFTGSDFLSYFDDRLFDLGTWKNLVGSDGLFNLDVSFSGYVPKIDFAFGERAEASAVPEPSALMLIILGVLGLWISRDGLRLGRFGHKE